jgi:hypothetical protein
MHLSRVNSAIINDCDIKHNNLTVSDVSNGGGVLLLSVAMALVTNCDIQYNTLADGHLQRLGAGNFPFEAILTLQQFTPKTVS